VKLQGVGGSGTGTAFAALDCLSQIKNVLTYQKGPVPEYLGVWHIFFSFTYSYSRQWEDCGRSFEVSHPQASVRKNRFNTSNGCRKRHAKDEWL
jgi:hypothetical protein